MCLFMCCSNLTNPNFSKHVIVYGVCINLQVEFVIVANQSHYTISGNTGEQTKKKVKTYHSPG